MTEPKNDRPVISEIIVVEGRDDTINLKRAVECYTIETHGFGIRRETWEELEKAYFEKGLIIFTDPDYSGAEIRRRLTEKFPDAKQAYLIKEDAMKKGDIGIENAEPEAIRDAFRKCRAKEASPGFDEVTERDLFEAGLTGRPDSSEMRTLVGKELGIGYANAKGMLRKLKGFGIGKEEFNEAVSTVNDKRVKR